MPGAVFLEGEAVTLRTFEEGDLDAFREIRNHPEIGRFLINHTPVNAAQAADHFEDLVSEDDAGVDLVICAGDDSRGVGYVRLNVDEASGNGVVGIFLLPDERRRGYGTEAAALLVDYGLRERRLHRIQADTQEHNVASQRLWEKLGFHRDGVLRDRVFKAGEYRDVYQYSVLADEWEGVPST